jgi:hypothetical protein
LGHTRLGQIPKSRKWNSVVELVLESMDAGMLASNVDEIANQTLDAARGGLQRGTNDPAHYYRYLNRMQRVYSELARMSSETL